MSIHTTMRIRIRSPAILWGSKDESRNESSGTARNGAGVLAAEFFRSARQGADRRRGAREDEPASPGCRPDQAARLGAGVAGLQRNRQPDRSGGPGSGLGHLRSGDFYL